MTTFLLIACIAAGQSPADDDVTIALALAKAARERPTPKAIDFPTQPTVKPGYAEFCHRIESGEPGLLCVNRPQPHGYFIIYSPTAAEIKALSLPDGVWLCTNVNGVCQMNAYTVVPKVAAVTADAPYTDPPGDHRHRCPIDGTIWSHHDRSSGAGDHVCPTCGTVTTAKYTGTLPPTNKAKAASPAVQKYKTIVQTRTIQVPQCTTDSRGKRTCKLVDQLVTETVLVPDDSP